MSDINEDMLEMVSLMHEDLVGDYDDEVEVALAIRDHLAGTSMPEGDVARHILAYYWSERHNDYEEVADALGDEDPRDEVQAQEADFDVFEDIEEYLTLRGLRNITISNASERLRFSRRELLDVGPDPERLEDVRVTLKVGSLEKLPVKPFVDIKNENATGCTICQEDFTDQDETRMMPCEHVFHKACVDTWLIDYSYKCPVCRKECGEYAAKL
jgi:hypothetical protein